MGIQNKMKFWILIFGLVYCDEKTESSGKFLEKFSGKAVFNSTLYMSTLAEQAMRSIRYYIEDMEDTEILSISPKSANLYDKLVDKVMKRLSYNLFFLDKSKNNLCLADVYVTFISRKDGSRPRRPRRAIGVYDMGCNKIEEDSIEDGIVKAVNQRKRTTTPAGRIIIDEYIKIFQDTLLELNRMKAQKKKMMDAINSE